MSTTESPVKLLALLIIIAGAIFSIAGVATYALASTTLADQKITVSDDASHFAGNLVDQPWEAYSQAMVINKHTMAITGGKTYAELPKEDPNRETAMTSSFLQASLFTSVVSFGVSTMAFALGIVMVLTGVALKKLGHA